VDLTTTPLTIKILLLLVIIKNNMENEEINPVENVAGEADEYTEDGFNLGNILEDEWCEELF